MPKVIGYVECPDCGERCEVREAKTGKPYVVCDECGVQHFYRSRKGIERLLARMERAEPRKAEPAGAAEGGEAGEGDVLGWL